MLDLSRLKKLRKTGPDSFMAACPSHSDTTPSLSITRKNGKALFHCHAGCSQADVLAALRDVGAWAPNGDGAARSGGFPTEFRGLPIRARYDYTDEAGNVVYTVFRAGEGEKKEFPIWCRGSWGIKAKGVKLIPYRLPKIAEAIDIYLAEGEKDVATLERMGLTGTTSPGGAEKWRARYAEHFNDRHHVVILPDNDEAGRKHAAQVAASLYGKVASLKILDLPGLPEKGDVSDWAAGRDPADAGETLSKLSDGAEEWKPEPGAACNAGMVFTPLGELLAEPDEKVAWLVEGLLPAGGFSLMSAKPKVGKSTLARVLALAVARGERFLDRETSPGAVLYLALEEKRSEVRNHFRLMGATGQDRVHVYVASAPEDGIELLRQAVERLKPALVVVDTLFKLVRIRDGNAYSEVSAALEPLLSMARQSGAHLLVTHHSGKGQRSGGDEVLGSTAIFGAVDTVLSLRRSERYRTIYSVNRYGRDLPETVIELDEGTGWVEASGSRREADESAGAEAIIEYLRAQDSPVERKDIFENVEGRKEILVASLQRLLDQKRVDRHGAGKRGDPYKYVSSFVVPVYSWEPENHK